MKITVEHVDGLRFRAQVGQHAVAVDVAVEDGGTDTAPSAPQLFAAAGACICEFVTNSCRLREIPLGRLSVVEATWHIEPEPPEDVKQRLIGVARHVTLVNTLARPPEVDRSVLGDGEHHGIVSRVSGNVDDGDVFQVF